MKTKPTIVLLAAFILVATGCADYVPLDDINSFPHCGFWHGLWHGIILPISFIVSLFDSDVAVYATYNTGGWYDFGFVLGCGSLLGSSS